MAKEVGNPYNLCTWNDDADCESCSGRDKLNCKWEAKMIVAFFMIYFPFLVSGWFGMAMVAKFSGAWWYLVVYGAFYIFFFGFFEIRILCSHCPYYGGESGFSLKCLANNGAMRLWKYHPEPMNSFERASLVVGFVFLGGFPVYANFYGVYFLGANYAAFGQPALLGMIGLAVLTLVSSISFFVALNIYVCSRCINFSCPINGVPKDIVDNYLRDNPVMMKAWEESGYKLG
jgi:hypothetical protein